MYFSPQKNVDRVVLTTERHPAASLSAVVIPSPHVSCRLIYNATGILFQIFRSSDARMSNLRW